MKRRFLSYIFVLITLLLAVMALFACSSSDKSKDECDHKFNEWKLIREAICGQEGKMAHRCTKCGEREVKYTDPTGHNIVIVKGKPSTCTENGISDSKVCHDCGIVLKQPTMLSKAEHQPEYTQGQPATCQAPGYTGTSRCKVCRIILMTSEEIPQLPHTESVIPGDNINCMQIGTTEGRFCTTCGVSTFDQRTGYGNHTYQNGTCIHCGETENVSKGLRYELEPDGKGFAVVGIGDCTDADIVIPRLYNGLPVVRIINSAFFCDIGINSVIIPSSVRSIGEQAFYSCRKLKSVIFMEGVEIIGASAFASCPSLEAIILPESLTYLGDGAFSVCSSLRSAVIGANREPKDLMIYSKAFSGCSALESVVIRKSVRYFSSDVFRQCYNLHSVTFDGTKDEWSQIELASQWYGGSSISVVRCIDGNVDVRRH